MIVFAFTSVPMTVIQSIIDLNVWFSSSDKKIFTMNFFRFTSVIQHVFPSGEVFLSFKRAYLLFRLDSTIYG
jgi:hypothetical protein